METIKITQQAARVKTQGFMLHQVARSAFQLICLKFSFN